MSRETPDRVPEPRRGGFDRDEYAAPAGEGDAPGLRPAHSRPGEDVPVSDTSDTASSRGASGRHASDSEPSTGAGGAFGAAIKEFFVVAALALAISFVVKTWLIQAFYIPSGSMENTLQVDDRVIVSKLTPGPMELKRGDIVVFEDPGSWLGPAAPAVDYGPVMTPVRKALMFVGLMPDTAENHLIKRVIGLPGDKVACCSKDGWLTVNGTPISEPYVLKGNKPSEVPFSVTVPEGRVWVMGDHRSDSSDSRFHDPSGTGSEGSVPIDRVVGRAVALVWPFSHATWLSNPSSSFATVPTAAAPTPAAAGTP
ncbi:MAG: signal peptidase I [Micrococcales bacterium]|nr:signal peptidase I [Micrococcales bacterium]